jgi:hypothetical protein
MAKLKTTYLWTLDEALELVRRLQDDTRQFGYHLAIGGGVINNGYSDKDLDLYFLPLDDQDRPEDLEGLLVWLTEQFGELSPINDYPTAVSHYALKLKTADDVVKRIDLFIGK